MDKIRFYSPREFQHSCWNVLTVRLQSRWQICGDSLWIFIFRVCMRLISQSQKATYKGNFSDYLHQFEGQRQYSPWKVLEFKLNPEYDQRSSWTPRRIHTWATCLQIKPRNRVSGKILHTGSWWSSQSKLCSFTAFLWILEGREGLILKAQTVFQDIAKNPF